MGYGSFQNIVSVLIKKAGNTQIRVIVCQETVPFLANWNKRVSK
ncbi:hypothetical protein BSM4216_1863 [Bacillus smithii]|nr:hypothetical protein BSM4216_1863 [Bacillus smithii]